MNSTPDPHAHQDFPEATVEPHRRGPSLVWLVPLVAVAIGLWLVYKTWSEQGPTITISFQTAEGIEAGKTRVKYREVDLGVVESVRLSDDGASVLLKAALVPGVESKLTETTRFWVVKAQVEGAKVSGLATLVSGAYVGLDPGEGGPPRRSFVGLEEPPKLLSHRHGTLYRLSSPTLGSISLGAPVLFRQFKVGDVVSAKLAADHSRVEIEVFIDAPHDRYVRKRSGFWNVSGLGLVANAEGVKLNVESLATLVVGGIAFDSPEAGDAALQAPEGTEFVLYGSEQESKERPILVSHPYLVYFDESVRGLTVGAPVEFKGIRIGTVKDILLERSPETGYVRIAVQMGLEPERLPLEQEDSTEARLKMAEMFAREGVRAQLKTGNLLTGQLFVDLDFYPDTEPAEPVYKDGVPVLASVPGALKGITDDLSGVLAKLNNLPIKQIGGQLQATVASVDRLVAGLNERLPGLLDSATRVSAGAEGLVGSAGKAADQADKTLAVFEAVAAEDGPLGSEVTRMLQELTDAARAIRLMAEYLERNPEALLRGRSQP